MSDYGRSVDAEIPGGPGGFRFWHRANCAVYSLGPDHVKIEVLDCPGLPAARCQPQAPQSRSRRAVTSPPDQGLDPMAEQRQSVTGSQFRFLDLGDGGRHGSMGRREFR